jgi:hypothetical protein
MTSATLTPDVRAALTSGRLGHPRVTLTVEADGANPVGMANYPIVHGTARLVGGVGPWTD